MRILHIFFASCSVSVIVVLFGDLLRCGIAPLPSQFRVIFGITLVYIILQMSLVRKKGVMSDLRTHESYGILVAPLLLCTSRMVHIAAVPGALLWILQRLQLLSRCWQLLRYLPISCCARLIYVMRM